MGQHLQALSLPLPCRLGGAAIAQEPAGPELPATGPPRPPISRYRALRLQGSRACSSGAPASPHTRRAKKSSPRHGAAAAEPRADCRRASSGGGRAGRRPRQMDDGDIPAFWPLLARPPRRRGCRRLPTNGNVRAPGHVCHAACESSRRRYLGCPRCPADDRAPWSLSSERHSDQCHHIRGALSAPRLHWARGLAMDPRHSLPLSQQTQTARLVPHPPHHGPSRAHGPSPIAHRDQDHSLPAARQAKAGQARPGFNAPLARQVLVLTLRLRSKALLSSPSSRLLPQPTAPRAPRQPAKERDNGHVGVCLCLCPAACPNRVSIASQRVLAASLGCRLRRRHNAITSHAPKRHRPAHAPGGPHRSTAAAAPLTVRLRLALLLSVHPCHVTTAQDTRRQQQQQQRMTANYSHPTTATCLRTNELRGTCVNVGFSSQGGPTDNNGPALRCASPANTTRLRPPPPDATLSTRRSQGALLQRRLLHPLRRLASAPCHMCWRAPPGLVVLVVAGSRLTGEIARPVWSVACHPAAAANPLDSPHLPRPALCTLWA